MPIEPAIESSFDLVSERFADLVAHQSLNRKLHQVTASFFTASNVQQLAADLVENLLSLNGLEQVSVFFHAGEGCFRLLHEKGPHSGVQPEFQLTPGQLKSNAHREEIFLRASGTVSPFPWKGAYPLDLGLDSLGVALVNCRPGDYVARDFAQRLCERAGQAMALFRAKQAERNMPPETASVAPTGFHWLEDWSNVMCLLDCRYRELQQLLRQVVANLGADRGSLMLYDEASRHLSVRAVCGVDEEVAERIRLGQQPCRRLRLGEGVAGCVAETLEPLIVNETERNPLFLDSQSSRVHSILCLPLHVGGVVLGVLNLTHREPGKSFTETHLQDGMRSAHQTAQALKGARLYHLAALEPSTEILLRPYLFQQAEEEISRSRRYQRHVSAVVVHLAGLETESNGQAELELARLLKGSLREMDRVGRLGPSTLALLLPETDSFGAMFLAERLHQLGQAIPILRERSLTVSMGVCSYPGQAEGVQGLFTGAELAMNSARRSQGHQPVALAGG